MKTLDVKIFLGVVFCMVSMRSPFAGDVLSNGCEIQPFKFHSQYTSVTEEFIASIERQNHSCMELAVYLYSKLDLADSADVLRSLASSAATNPQFLLSLFDKHRVSLAFAENAMTMFSLDSVDCVECKLDEVKRRMDAVSKVQGYQPYRQHILDCYESQALKLKQLKSEAQSEVQHFRSE